MHEAIILSSILVALLVGAMSPGPSFVLVSRLALAGTRRDGVSAAIGMGLGGALFAVLALLGLVSVLSQFPWIFMGLKVLGGLYLLYLGVSIWRSASNQLHPPTKDTACLKTTAARSMQLAFTTQVANPKTVVVYASIFASLLPQNPSWWLIFAIPPAVFVVEAGWYATIATVLATEKPQSYYLKSKSVIDRLAGIIMGSLGLRLVVSAARGTTE